MNFRSLRLLSPLTATLCNLVIAYAVYFLARIIYLLENLSYFSQGLTFNHLMELFGGGLMFDTSAILLTNSLYIVMMLFPLHLKEVAWYQKLCQALFLTVNGLALAVNLCDAVYFRFTMRRTTTTVFSEFSNEGNLGSIFLTETINHIYLVVIFVVIIWVMYRLYRKPAIKPNDFSWLHYSGAALLSLLLMTPLVIGGIRGGFTKAVRPITISNANQYAARPIEAALVLNTPFSLYRTIGKSVFVVPEYFSDEHEMASVYSPIHIPADSITMTKKNVVVLIVESFGREYIGALNEHLEDGKYKGYTPCIDSIISRSITFRHSYCNGRKSIDGMPSILASIPMFVEPFFLTPASMNHVDGIASLLAAEGYKTAFFHGAQRGSMGFMAFAKSIGFQEYYGREDFNEDKRFGGDNDFDGTWAIWDEPFLQYYATKMSEMKEPFMTAVFTASSHHPYVIPEKYKDVYPEEGIEIHKCIRYTDMALGRFFETASRESWFKNTIFIITSDHTNTSDHAFYQTDLGGFCSPIIIYEPGNADLMPEMQDKIAQQIDILPTVMGMLHYEKPYFGFGIDLLSTPADSTWAVNYMNGIYQYVKHGHVLQFDGQNTRAVYALSDSLMQNNLLNKVSHQQPMEKELKAIIQQYMERMTQDRLTP
ncbi:LTA synthase family protein [Prevotella sp. E13-27]|uniref:LTA synthase family protein n=1 Tax=Prevotella sp. E13-27 TaxID=2938122 RepID=UPI00200A11FC|nr:LTA synthase family protein [Prevotella sp. E13-27]MCK8621786.1 LTA synthase family protein [Prevotella sp. E13-27]